MNLHFRTAKHKNQDLAEVLSSFYGQYIAFAEERKEKFVKCHIFGIGHNKAETDTSW